MLRLVLLGLLGSAPRHGYELKSAFEEALGGTWPLNVGQVYMTLQRLEDDGLVSSEVVPQDARPDRRVYSITESGRLELKRWTDEPSQGPVRLRDEFVLKILTRVLAGADALSLVWRQRQEHLRTLAALQDQRRGTDLGPATALLVDAAILRLEADLKWLDRCEERFREDR